MKISYEYFDGSTKKKPLMSKGLEDLLQRSLVEAYGDRDFYVVHAGTVGDERHRKDNPKSFHLHHPPDAIDIEKVYFPIIIDGLPQSVCVNLKANALNWKSGRTALAEAVKKEGGRTYHALDKTKNHLHIEVKL
jgi:hypothetical protein